MSDPADGYGRKSVMADDEIERMTGDALADANECALLCDEILVVEEALATAEGVQRLRLLARFRAISLRRRTLGCRRCFFT